MKAEKNLKKYPQCVADDIKRQVHELSTSVYQIRGHIKGKTLLPFPQVHEYSLSFKGEKVILIMLIGIYLYRFFINLHEIARCQTGCWGGAESSWIQWRWLWYASKKHHWGSYHKMGTSNRWGKTKRKIWVTIFFKFRA